jgi:hypothetical protein
VNQFIAKVMEAPTHQTKPSAQAPAYYQVENMSSLTIQSLADNSI